MSDSRTSTPANASSGSEQDASSTAPSVPATNTVDPFTVLFNAVEVANRRGAYSLKVRCNQPRLGYGAQLAAAAASAQRGSRRGGVF